MSCWCRCCWWLLDARGGPKDLVIHIHASASTCASKQYVAVDVRGYAHFRVPDLAFEPPLVVSSVSLFLLMIDLAVAALFDTIVDIVSKQPIPHISPICACLRVEKQTIHVNGRHAIQPVLVFPPSFYSRTMDRVTCRFTIVDGRVRLTRARHSISHPPFDHKLRKRLRKAFSKRPPLTILFRQSRERAKRRRRFLLPRRLHSIQRSHE